MQPPTPVIRPVATRKRLSKEEATEAKSMYQKVDQIQSCLKNLMELPTTDLTNKVQTCLRQTLIMPVVQDLLTDLKKQLGHRVLQVKSHSKDQPSQTIVSRLRKTVTLQQQMMWRLIRLQASRKSLPSRPLKGRRALPHLRKAVRVWKPGLLQQRRHRKAASGRSPHQAGSSASSSTAPSNPCDASAAGRSANGRVARSKPSLASSPSAPTASEPRWPARSEASERSASESCGPISCSTGRSTPTRT